MNVGARPVFADVDRDSQNITAETVAAALTPATKAVVCVHLAGWPCDMDAMTALAEQHGLYLIEDCAQAHGATWRGRPVGGFGHVGCWSFCQDKIMTTGGEGGMVTTNAKELSDTSLMLLVHPTLEDSQITQTCHTLEAVMAEVTAPNTAARASG